MCLVIFSVYKSSAVDPDDDLNVEYPNGAKSDFDWYVYVYLYVTSA